MSQDVVLQIQGMHCGACVRRVTNALEKVGGVKINNVEVGSASVTVDPQSVRPEQLVEAVNRIGFQATVAQ
jgi:copper chaperone CopZ